jgi:hypothetical protein
MKFDWKKRKRKQILVALIFVLQNSQGMHDSLLDGSETETRGTEDSPGWVRDEGDGARALKWSGRAGSASPVRWGGPRASTSTEMRSAPRTEVAGDVLNEEDFLASLRTRDMAGLDIGEEEESRELGRRVGEVATASSTTSSGLPLSLRRRERRSRASPLWTLRWRGELVELELNVLVATGGSWWRFI